MRTCGIVLCLLLVSASLAQAQGEGDVERSRVPIDMSGIELEQFLQLVSTELNVRFLYDERVKNRRVTLLSPKDIARSELFGVTLSVLEMQNFTAVRTGSPEAEIWKIVPFCAPIQNPVNKGRVPVRSLDDVDRLESGDDLATLVVRLKHMDARSAFIALQGMASDPRMVQAIESANTVVITDTANNIRRMGDAVRRMDQPMAEETAPSFRVEAVLFEAPVEGLPKPEDVAALLSALEERDGKDGVRVLYRWRGQVQDDRSVSSEQSSEGTPADRAGVTVKLEMTTTFARPSPPKTESPLPPQAQAWSEYLWKSRRASLESDVSMQLRVALTEAREGAVTRSARESVTLSGAQGTWLSVMAGSGGTASKTLLFFARAEVVK